MSSAHWESRRGLAVVAVLLCLAASALLALVAHPTALEASRALLVRVSTSGVPDNVGLRQRRWPSRAPAAAAAGATGGKKRCAVVNAVHFHLDVMAGLAYTFQEAGCATDVFYLHEKSLGIEEVMEPWFKGRLLSHENMTAESQPEYDLILLATFPEVAANVNSQTGILLRRPPHQRILLAVHNPAYLLEIAGPLGPLLLLADAVQQHPGGDSAGTLQPVQLLALAPINAAYSSSLFGAWAADVRRWLPGWGQQQQQQQQQQGSGSEAPPLEVPWIVPLTPWAPADEGADEDGGLASSGEGEYEGRLQHLCIQGGIDPIRRDYGSAFAAASHPAVLAQLERRGERLLLVGANRASELPVPDALQPFVERKSSLDFAAYYQLLSRCRAILTAFGSELYLVNKTSSTMAAALQVGAPVLTEGRVLEAYQYTPADAAFAYDAPDGATAPDVAALAAEEGVQMSQLLRSLAGGAAHPSRRRRLIEGRDEEAEAAWRQRLAEREAEEEGEESLGLAAPMESSEQQRPARRRAAEEQQKADSKRQPQQRRQEPQKRQQQAARKHAADEDDEEAAPAAGTYAAALLAAFDDDASRAAHTAAWRAKRQLMRRNVEAARLMLRDTATWAAAAANAPP